MIAIENLGYRLLIICAIMPITLLGCQSNNSHINDNAIDNEYVSIDPVREDDVTVKVRTKDANKEVSSDLLTTLNKYQWQLTEVISSPTNKTANKAFIHTVVNSRHPLRLDVRPSAFILALDCQKYRLSYTNYYQAPFSYSIDYISEAVNTSCDGSTATLSSQDKASFKANLQSLFLPDYSRQFYFELNSENSSTRELQLKMTDGTILVWKGQLKSLLPVSGIPITAELLTRYQWHLKSARNSQQQLIAAFLHKDVPITAFFNPNASQPYIGFSTGCNGVGGPYILTADQKMLIGSGPQTVMGCSDLLETIENKVSSTLLNSESQLTLALAPNKSNTITDANSKDLPAYLLTQRLATGETLIWQNEALARP